jgi:hypothetical protein
LYSLLHQTNTIDCHANVLTQCQWYWLYAMPDGECNIPLERLRP